MKEGQGVVRRTRMREVRTSLVVMALWKASLLVLLMESCLAEEGPLVTTPLGQLRGRLLSLGPGEEVMAFQGVPYAKPPVGRLRFQAPEPVGKWEGVRGATKPGQICIQDKSFMSANLSVGGFEDCLYLNVYTHDMTKKSPVLVHIHGGAFLVGNSEMYNRTNLMVKDMVLVTINYRLGVMGFLSMESEEMPGNQGLKDQAMALRWVKENIASFGGDPEQVTILGESAGGASVYSHLVSPISKGLFQRAIISSGSTLNPWALMPRGLARENAEKLMSLIGCPTTPKEALQCAQEKDATEIVQKMKSFIVTDQDPVLRFQPCFESNGPGAFLTYPISGWEHSSVPLLISMSSAEGLLMTGGQIPKLKEYSDKFEKKAPYALIYWKTPTNLKEVTEKIKQFYFDGSEITLNNFHNFTNMFTDRIFLTGIIDGANSHKGPVHFYFFDFYYPDSLPGIDKSLVNGAIHCADIMYIFQETIGEYFKPPETEETKDMRRNLIDLYVNFIKNGSVSMEGVDDWKPWTKESPTYLHITNNGKMQEKGLLQERYNFWKDLNNQYNLQGLNEY